VVAGPGGAGGAGGMRIAGAGAGGGEGSWRGEGRGRATCTQVQPPWWMYPACPVARRRAMPGSAVQACWMRLEPSSPHTWPSILVAVSITRRVPASSDMGWG
jgi:hypothetical protein